MNEKLLILLGTWLVGDAVFSLFTYINKEGLKENSIKIVRSIIGATIVWMAF